MSPSTVPITCSLALASLSGAVFSHWWSLREFAPPLANIPRVTAPITPVAPPASPLVPVTVPAPLVPVNQPVAPPPPAALASQPAPAPAPAPVAEPSAAQKEFYETLLDEVRQLKKTNLALRDQMAETNRDLMKLEFRVDTHSASFRPLPVTEELSTLDSSTLDSPSLDSSSLDSSSLDPSIPDPGPGVLPPRAVRVDRPN